MLRCIRNYITQHALAAIGALGSKLGSSCMGRAEVNGSGPNIQHQIDQIGPDIA